MQHNKLRKIYKCGRYIHYVVDIGYILLYLYLYKCTYLIKHTYIDTQHIYRQICHIRAADCCFTFTWLCWLCLRASQALQLAIHYLSIQQKTPQHSILHPSANICCLAAISSVLAFEYWCVFVVGLRVASKHIAACCFRFSFVLANFDNYTRSAHSVKWLLRY